MIILGKLHKMYNPFNYYNITTAYRLLLQEYYILNTYTHYVFTCCTIAMTPKNKTGLSSQFHPYLSIDKYSDTLYNANTTITLLFFIRSWYDINQLEVFTPNPWTVLTFWKVFYCYCYLHYLFNYSKDFFYMVIIFHIQFIVSL